MASNAVVRRHVDPDIFKEFIKSKGVSIRQLGTLCQTNEKSIRRMLQDQEVTLNVALDLCKYFNCTPLLSWSFAILESLLSAIVRSPSAYRGH